MIDIMPCVMLGIVIGTSGLLLSLLCLDDRELLVAIWYGYFVIVMGIFVWKLFFT